jgi:hypothetical protein
MEMSASRAVGFLRKHQPLPPDKALQRGDIEELDAVRKYLMKDPVGEALELLLGVFGDGSGFGVYQLMEDTIAAYAPADVVPVLGRKLESGGRSVRYWCTRIASRYPNDSLVDPLASNLTPEDHDLRDATIAALENIGTPRARSVLRTWLPHETDKELREIIQAALGE